LKYISFFVCKVCGNTIPYSAISENNEICLKCKELKENNERIERVALSNILEDNLAVEENKKILNKTLLWRQKMAFIEFDNTILHIDNIISVDIKQEEISNFFSEEEETEGESIQYCITIMTRNDKCYRITEKDKEKAEEIYQHIRKTIELEQAITNIM